ncbi:MAG: hypothetical protein QM762_12575 [Chryseolinea sp.]
MENWGVGNRKDEKAFQTLKIGNENVELIMGEYPHSRRDNNVYARYEGGRVVGFDGHRVPFKITIEESNYLKDSHYSGSEIRKGGKVTVHLNDVQIFEDFCRSYQRGYELANNWIIAMEDKWDWYPHNVESVVGRMVGYREQLFKIERVIVSQACLILETLNGQPRKRFLYEDREDLDIEGPETSVKVEITSEALTWYPKAEV